MKIMKKHLRSMLTMLCMVALGVVGANAQTTPTIDDVKVISSDYTFIADDYTSNGTAKVAGN